MGNSVLANLWASEGTVSGTAVVTFPWRSRRLTITNDSASANLTVTMGGGTFTLKPTESLSVKFWGTAVSLAGASVPYRLWIFG